MNPKIKELESKMNEALEAMLQLAGQYPTGSDEEKYCLEKAAKGYARAMIRLGSNYRSKDSEHEAVRWFTRAIEDHDAPDAMLHLGIMRRDLNLIEKGVLGIESGRSVYDNIDYVDPISSMDICFLFLKMNDYTNAGKFLKKAEDNMNRIPETWRPVMEEPFNELKKTAEGILRR